jgi:hypothetical protein
LFKAYAFDVRRLAALAVLGLVLVPVTSASAPKGQTLATRGELEEFSANGGRVALHVRLDASDGSICHYGSVWQPRTGKIVRFDPPLCGQSGEVGSRFDGITLADAGAAWAQFQYGNRAYCDGAFAATLANPKARRTIVGCDGFPEEDVDFDGHDDVLVASYTDDGWDTSEVFRIVGTKATKILTLANQARVYSADAGRILVFSGRDLIVYSAAGKQLATYPDPAPSCVAQLSGPHYLAFCKDGTVTSYKVLSGKKEVARKVARGVTWLDYYGGVAVYARRGAVHLLGLASGRDRVVARVKGLVGADLEAAGLFYGWNDPKGGERPGRITFIPRSALTK